MKEFIEKIEEVKLEVFAGAEEIRLYEELSLNSHPAIQTKCYDGWLLRFANGYTARANSVNMIYPSTIDLQTKIKVCEALLAKAKEQGAHTAYLQVVQSNQIAYNLYKKLGYQKVYSYWYRAKENKDEGYEIV